MGPEEPARDVGTCQVVSMVSVTTAASGAAERVPEVVHQVVPDSVPMVTLQDAASVSPRLGAGSVMLNFRPRASPSSTVTADCGEIQWTSGGAFSVLHPRQNRANSAQVKDNFHSWDITERYFVDRGVDAWLKEGAVAP